MKRSTYNPTRRNRNIGTEKQGHGQDNELCIPESWRDLTIFYEKLKSPVSVIRRVSGKDFTFLVEPTLDDYKHCCTVDDLCTMMSYVKRQDLYHFDLVVLRQPTRKQRLLSDVWGRLAFYYEAGRHKGVAIVLEAQPVKTGRKWSKSLTPDDRKELDRLIADGHLATFGKRHITVESPAGANRSTQLYRTLPHEVGHYAQYARIDSPDRYDSLTLQEKEAFAHRYADELGARLKDAGEIPFERILVGESLGRDGLKRTWFESE